MSTPLIGIDVGGTNVRVVSGLPTSVPPGAVLHAPVAGSYTALLDLLADLVVESCGPTKGLAPVVAVGVPGAVIGESVRFAPSLPFLDGQPLGRDLGQRLQAPVRLANDVHCALLAEQRLGAAAGCRDAILVVVGTGIGGATLIDGKPYAGSHGTAGAFGSLAADAGADSRYGSWEQVASGRALTERARRLNMGPVELLERATTGDAECRSAVGDWAYLLGRGLAGIASAWDPELLIIGECSARTSPPSSPTWTGHSPTGPRPLARSVPRVVARLGSDAGALGALCLAASFAEERRIAS